jgi:tetratricopeptide (TPR) repeat protein
MYYHPLFFVHRKYEEARVTYLKVLELDPRNAIALGFLGIVYHLLGDLDKAIVKYHEVKPLVSYKKKTFSTNTVFELFVSP